jgi:hypothetical protein
LQKKNNSLLVKIAEDLDFCRDFQENLLDQLCNLKTEVQDLNNEMQNQKELNTRILEILTTKSSSNSDTISAEIFQKKPKLAGIHQLWWAVSIRFIK